MVRIRLIDCVLPRKAQPVSKSDIQCNTQPGGFVETFRKSLARTI